MTGLGGIWISFRWNESSSEVKPNLNAANHMLVINQIKQGEESNITVLDFLKDCFLGRKVGSKASKGPYFNNFSPVYRSSRWSDPISNFE